MKENSEDLYLYTNWAEQQLTNGNPSDNILMLASLGLDKILDRCEIMDYFDKCLREFNIIKPSEENIAKEYSCYLCEQLIENKLPYEAVVSDLDHLGLCTGYKYKLLYIWDYLQQDLNLFYFDEDTNFLHNLEMDKDNIERFVIKTAKQYIQLIKRNFPEECLFKFICNSCFKVDKPMRYIKSEYEHILSCPHCSSDVISLETYAGRELWLLHY